MKQTDHYTFKKPEGTDFFSVEHHNQNMELIDEALNKKADKEAVYTKAHTDLLLQSKVDTFYHGATATSLLSNHLQPGIHLCSNWLDYPVDANDGQGHCQVLFYTGSDSDRWETRIFKAAHDNKVWIRQRNRETWYPWEKLATNTDLEKKANISVYGTPLPNISDYKEGVYTWASEKAALWEPNQQPGARRLWLKVWRNLAYLYELIYIDGQGAGEHYYSSYENGQYRWNLVAAATPPGELDLPLAAGISVIAGAKSAYSKDQFGRVLVHIAAQKTDAFSSGPSLIATLPIGYRPRIAVHSVGWCSTSTNVSGVYIHPDGNLYVTVTGPSQENILGQICFIAA